MTSPVSLAWPRKSLAVGNAQIAVDFRIQSEAPWYDTPSRPHHDPSSHAPPPTDYVFDDLLTRLIVILSADICQWVSDFVPRQHPPTRLGQVSLAIRFRLRPFQRAQGSPNLLHWSQC